ncbi:MAG TPA: fructosamine kinase family protein [Longimicrobiaceae bacterium]|nr:fructosamine kinase family protein [Longimicrobiaceae bacterium]
MISLPDAVREGVEARFGAIRSAQHVSGGCINPAARLETKRATIFVKYNDSAPAGMFEVEAEGLRALRAAASDDLRVPEVLAACDAGKESGAGWIALEWLEPGRGGKGTSERLGRGLAALHRAEAGGWGWERDGFIGSLPQPNHPTASWADFWRERRLLPMLRLARDAGAPVGSSAEWDQLLAALPDLLAAGDDDGPSLLHGDLWGGNVLVTDTGEPALVDPAAYRGHREVDLAMSELFGGFDASFHAAYRESWPLRPGYAEVRRGVYQLYYLLVHVVLFAGGYAASTAATLRRVLAAG